MGASVNGGKGGATGGRRARARRHAPMAEINVTPFVDVMLVLLVIFMVTAPMMTAGVQVDLPSAKGSQLATDKQPIVVSIKANGQLYLGQEDTTPLKIDEISSKLRAIAQNRGGTDEPIFVWGDKGVEYGVVARLMSRIKDAGFKKVSLVLEPEG